MKNFMKRPIDDADGGAIPTGKRNSAIRPATSVSSVRSPTVTNDDQLIGLLPVRPLQTYQHQAVPYQRPVEIACFSYDSERRVHVDDSELTYYYPPNLNDHVQCNLSSGYPDQFRQRDESVPEHLDALLYTLQHHRAQLERDSDSGAHKSGDKSSSSVLGVAGTIVTWRGIMTKMLCTPYSSNDPWSLVVCRVNGVIYMAEMADSKAHAKPTNDRQARMCFWGYRFESLCTIDCHPRDIQSPNSDPRVTERYRLPVNNNIQCMYYSVHLLTALINNEPDCSVVKTKLGEHALILGGEVDCQLDDKVPNDPARNYVELKTSLDTFNNQRARRTFERFKLLRMYVQSFLLGIPRIIVGYRTEEGGIRRLETLETLQIPRMIRQKGYWDPAVCLNFADSCLGFLKQNVTEDDRTKFYQLAYSPATRSIELRTINYTNQFIPSDYDL
jgi:RAT1-interacting protein